MRAYASLLACFLAGAGVAQFKFTPFELGANRPGGARVSETYAYGISADGKKIAGKHYTFYETGQPNFGAETYAVMYTNTNGVWSMANLGDNNPTGNHAKSQATGFVPNGSRAYGLTFDGPAYFGPISLMGTQHPDWNRPSAIAGVSYDGTMAVGTGSGNFTSDPNAWWTHCWFLWGSSGTQAFLPWNGSGSPTCMSWDGQTFAGWSEDPDPNTFNNRAFRHRQGIGYEFLPLPSFFKHTYPVAISGDAQTIVGYGAEPNLSQEYPFMYSESEGARVIVGPGSRPRGRFNAVNQDGTVAVGLCYEAGVPSNVLLWTPQTGSMNLNEYLTANGIDLGDYRLHEATGISADGRTICGNAYRPNHETGYSEWVGFVVQIQIPQGLASLSLAANDVVGGKFVRGTATLARNATVPETVTLTSSNPAVASVPASVTVPAGAKSIGFNITTQGVSTATEVTITATKNGISWSRQLMVNPAQISSFKVTYPGQPDPLDAGKPATGVITLDGDAPAGGVAVKVWDNNAFAVLLPNTEAEALTVTVLEGESVARFTIETRPSANPGTKTIYAKQGGLTLSTPLPMRAWYAISSLYVTPATVQSGGTTVGKVKINLPARAGGELVTITYGNKLSGSTGVVVPAGTTTATFTISADAVSATTGSYVKAALGGKTLQVNMTVKAPALHSVSMPTSFTGGDVVPLTVHLTGVAAVDTVVTLTDNTSALATPTQIVIPAGQSSATINVNSSAVATAQVDRAVIASYAGISRRATFTINP